MVNALIVLVVIFVIGCVIYYQLMKKKRKQSGCGSGCSYCHYRGQCSFEKEEEKENLPDEEK